MLSSAKHLGRRSDSAQATLDFLRPDSPGIPITSDNGRRAIEDAMFPFEELSDIAEIESWRKEVNRPLSHIHKWWAQRLGSVFRAIAIATIAPAKSDLIRLFYGNTRLPEAVVFDPFMGSGTTVIEALKLGSRAIGRDINSVAWFMVRNALKKHDRKVVLSTFKAIEQDVRPLLRPYYMTALNDGRKAEVLYYFWVKTIACPNCNHTVDLRSSYVFAQHAYPKKHPEAQAVCPKCGEVNKTCYNSAELKCRSCNETFNPQDGPAMAMKAKCPYCSNRFSIAQTAGAAGKPPDHRLYAKLVLLSTGEKVYMRASADDYDLYDAAALALAQRQTPYPLVRIEPGYNTNQVLKYNYRFWHEMFNARQLLGISVLGERIAAIQDQSLRELFICLLSGTLEFNNMFASYKGEGTGAVRHMFSHHILKPERVPLEANLWGTPKSSGSFSTLFESRILSALNYAEDPFELKLISNNGKRSSQKIYGLSQSFGYEIAETYNDFWPNRQVYLSCGDSSHTDIASGSVDAVISDPPFFDNVHYSQLADFFYVWQRHFLGRDLEQLPNTTRSEAEVQNTECATFTERLCSVWRESHRVLKDDGLLVFTYHHSRSEGWSSILSAIMEAGFSIVATHPIKAEMSVATPKQQAREPIDLDIIIVCRKRTFNSGSSATTGSTEGALSLAREQIARLRSSGRSLSRNDVRIVVMAQMLRVFSAYPNATQAQIALKRDTAGAELFISNVSGRPLPRN